MRGFAFILPGPELSRQISQLNEELKDLRPDQGDYVYHLLSSWGVGEGTYASDFLPSVRRAAAKARNNRP